MDQLSVRPGSGKRGRFGNAGNADLLFDNGRRAGKTRRLGSKRLTVKDAKRHIKHRCQRMERRLVGFQIDTEHTGNRRRVDIGAGQFLHHEVDHLVRLATTRTADAKHDILRAIDQL